MVKDRDDFLNDDALVWSGVDIAAGEWTYAHETDPQAVVRARSATACRVTSLEDLEAQFGPFDPVAVHKAYRWDVSSRSPTWPHDAVADFAATLGRTRSVRGEDHVLVAVSDFSRLPVAGNRAVLWTVTRRSWANALNDPPPTGSTCDTWPRTDGSPPMGGVSVVVDSGGDVYRRRVYPFHATLCLLSEVPV